MPEIEIRVRESGRADGYEDGAYFWTLTRDGLVFMFDGGYHSRAHARRDAHNAKRRVQRNPDRYGIDY